MQNKLFALFVVLMLVSSQAMATTTWTRPSTNISLCTESTGTGSAPSASTDGLALSGLSTAQVCVESTTGTLTAGTLYAYLWNPASSGPDGGYSGIWNRAPDLDLTVAAGINGCFLGINFRSNGTRLAYVPTGLGVANKVWILGFK